MYQQTRVIRLRETDATGVLYFSEKLKLALEAFEAYLSEKGYTLQQMIERGEFLIPIVHAEADYTASLRAGDVVKIELTVEKIGTSSFTLKTTYWCQEKQVGQAKIVHVSISPKTGKSIPIPQLVLTALQGI